jgi:hypothetical protein
MRKEIREYTPEQTSVKKYDQHGNGHELKISPYYTAEHKKGNKSINQAAGSYMISTVKSK